VLRFINKPASAARLYDCLCSVLAPEGGVQRPAALPAPESKQRFSASILVAEDNPVNQDVVRHMLAILGCSIEIAQDGILVVEAAKLVEYDLLFMDCQMPRMDGFAATRAIREREAALGLARRPIIALTANAIAGDRERCLAAGMDDYLSKPFDLTQLRGVLARWIPEKAVAVEDAAPGTEAAQATGLSPLGAGGEVIFDREGLLDRIGGDLEFLEIFVVKFVDSTRELMSALSDAIERGDRDTIHLQAHSIKGAAASIGAEAMRAIASEMETLAKGGFLSDQGRLQGTLEQAFEQFQAVVAELPG
jgi:CheY-like chemotaxis protein